MRHRGRLVWFGGVRLPRSRLASDGAPVIGSRYFSKCSVPFVVEPLGCGICILCSTVQLAIQIWVGYSLCRVPAGLLGRFLHWSSQSIHHVPLGTGVDVRVGS